MREGRSHTLWQRMMHLNKQILTYIEFRCIIIIHMTDNDI